MDSLIPVFPIAAALIGAAGMAGLARLRTRVAMIWGGSALVQLGLWISAVTLITRLPLRTAWGAWSVVTGTGSGGSMQWLAVDASSWPIAIAMLTLASAAVLTSLVRIAETRWQDLALVAVYSGLGLAACFADSIPGVMIAWAALDLAGILMMLRDPRHTHGSRDGFAVLGFGLVATTAVALALIGRNGAALSLSGITPGGASILTAAAVMRLGAAIHRSAQTGLPGTGPVSVFSWEAASSAGALVVIARAAVFFGETRWGGLVAAAAGLFALTWALRGLFRAGTIRTAGPWTWGLGGLTLAAAAVGLDRAAATFAVLLLLGQGLVRIPDAGPSRYRWLYLLVVILASGLPFSPAWETAALVEMVSLPLGLLCAVGYAGLLAGFVSLEREPGSTESPIVPGVRSIYLGGLILVVVGLAIAGWAPMLIGGSWTESWWGGGLTVLFTAGWLLAEERIGVRFETVELGRGREMAAAWLRRFWRRGITAAGFGLAVLARLLEGDAALLWALVLLSLIVSLFAQLGLGA